MPTEGPSNEGNEVVSKEEDRETEREGKIEEGSDEPKMLKEFKKPIDSRGQTMLEEALADPKYSPAEAASAMLAYVQVELEAGGPGAEERFFKLFTLLCNRIFGQLDDDYRHQVGG